MTALAMKSEREGHPVNHRGVDPSPPGQAGVTTQDQSGQGIPRLGRIKFETMGHSISIWIIYPTFRYIGHVATGDRNHAMLSSLAPNATRGW